MLRARAFAGTGVSRRKATFRRLMQSCNWTSKMPQIMDPVPPILSVLGHWAIVLATLEVQACTPAGWRLQSKALPGSAGAGAGAAEEKAPSQLLGKCIARGGHAKLSIVISQKEALVVKLLEGTFSVLSSSSCAACHSPCKVV